MSQTTESKISKNKKAFLHIIDILKNTDEDHPITANRICESLYSDYNIQLERRSVGRDLRLLMETGADIVFCQDNKLGCYMASHQFEDWEIKVLVDAVAQAKFLRHSVSVSLISRLLETTSEYKKIAIKDATVDMVHSKTKNKLTQVNIDVLLEAINRGKKVSFQYCFLNENLDLVPRKDGREYLVNPYQLMWNKDTYYLICNYEGYSNLSYYRLDKIKGVVILDDMEIKGPEQLLGSDYESIIKD
ncbi:MAG: WYL domain-containing protein, partial [Anaerovoracaceae bacterium]